MSWIHEPLAIVRTALVNPEPTNSRHTEFTEMSGLSFVGIALQWSFISLLSEQCCVVLPLHRRIFWMDLTSQRQHSQLRKGKCGHLFPLLGSIWQWPVAAVFFLDSPSSHPAHLLLTQASSHTCVSTFFPSYSHITTFPHLISSLFLQSRVNGRLLDSILQAQLPPWLFAYHVVHSGSSLPNFYPTYVTE